MGSRLLKEKYEKICETCGVSFLVWRYRKDKARFCSYSCWAKSRTGEKHPMFNKKNSYCGNRHWNWKGGIWDKKDKERVRFLKYFQKKIFERDNYTCQICGSKGGHLQVDHIQPWSEYVEGRFDINNCRTLCMDCHYFVTFNKPKPKEIITWGHNFKEVY